jgi:hypothetical protein
MEELNYFRSMKRCLSAIEKEISKDSRAQFDLVRSDLVQFEAAAKFILPSGGRVFDTDLKGLETLKLPYERIVVEFSSGAGKMLLLVSAGLDGFEIIPFAAFTKDVNSFMPWSVFPYVCICRGATWHDSVLDTDVPDNLRDSFAGSLVLRYLHRDTRKDITDKKEASDVGRLLGPCCRSVLELLEALSCKNITTSDTVPRKTKKRGNPFPFDSYKILTVTNSKEYTSGGEQTGRTPREHLRRGHIHRYHTKQGIIKLWINAVVVNAGVGGKLEKSYNVIK